MSCYGPAPMNHDYLVLNFIFSKDDYNDGKATHCSIVDLILHQSAQRMCMWSSDSDPSESNPDHNNLFLLSSHHTIFLEELK